MPVEVVLRSYGDGGVAQRQVASRLYLEEPQQIFLLESAQDISGYEKNGADLTVHFTSGDSLAIDDFFVMGEDGDYSRLVTETGDVLVTGLMAPEPELQAVADVLDDVSTSDETQPQSGEAPGTAAHEGTDPLLLVGAGLAGLATSSTVDFFDDSSSRGSSQKSSTVDELAASDLEESLVAIEGDESGVGFADAVSETSSEINVLFENLTGAGSDLLSDLFAENAL
ncbi:BapA/Bap/LapF family prefix-like domain-containing protein [Celeribacter sp. SCSIO 80788]|uniref:BapA/Bap/LapF family prefix-like domain-containing protein n=1 Tax=Celeribacter sp. SCSIO 80788 TaxID=3117013 RepID=UPI003DA6321A